MRILFVLAIIVLPVVANAQLRKLNEKKILLGGELNNSGNEYSGITSYKNQVLLICQNARMPLLNKIYGIDTTLINESLINHSAITKHTSYYFRGLNKLVQTLKETGETYDGFEGAVVVGDSVIFFTVETKTQTCYIVKGKFFEENGSHLIALGDFFAIGKPCDNKDKNAGFESIYYDEDQERLLTIFERNRITDEFTIVSCTLSFGDDAYTHFKAPLCFRLTDVSYKKGAVYPVLGIQHHYDGSKTEIDFYVGEKAGEMNEAKKQMQGHDPLKESYTAILAFYPYKKELSFKPVAYVSFDRDNWEGILHYRTGFLAVSDTPGNRGTMLSFFDLTPGNK